MPLSAGAVVLAATAFGYSIWLRFIAGPPPQLSGDEAVAALMALRIMELQEFPLYIWKAHYGGTIGSVISALYFKVFGVSSFVFSCVGATFALATGVATYFLGDKLQGRNAGLIAAALILVPAYGVFELAGFVVGGVYSEGLLFTAVLLLVFPALANSQKPSPKRSFLTGVLLGAGVWTSPFILPLFLAAAVYLALCRNSGLDRRGLLLLAAGCLAGALPAIAYFLQNTEAMTMRLSGRFLYLDRAAASLPPLQMAGAALSGLWNRLSQAPGMLLAIPRLAAGLLGLDFLSSSRAAVFSAAAALLYSGVLAYALGFFRESIRQLKSGTPGTAGFMALYCCIFPVFYVLVAEPGRARYLVPLAIPLAILAGAFLFRLASGRGPVFLLPAAFLILFNATGLHRAPSAQDLPALGVFLEKAGLSAGYSDYNTAYPVVFETRERVLISPTLFGAEYDRKPEYTARVRAAGQAAYIINPVTFPAGARELEEASGRLGVAFNKHEVAGFLVYQMKNIPPEVLRQAAGFIDPAKKSKI